MEVTEKVQKEAEITLQQSKRDCHKEEWILQGTGIVFKARKYRLSEVLVDYT